MTYSTPRTWSPGETVTAAIMNAHVRDQLNAIAPKALVVGIGGVSIATGVVAYIEVPISMILTGWTLVANASGSLVIDVWKDTYANFPPVVGDSIAGTEKPTLSSAQKNQDLSLSTWSTALTAGDVLAINVDSVSGIAQATLTLRGTPA